MSPDATPRCRYEQPPGARRVFMEQGGPLLVEGPVEVVLEDGSTVVSERFMVALCTCGRTATQPWCDTSHRRRVSEPAPERGSGSSRQRPQE
ncbi:CDGSH iron-sulfur domain-containing protein [Streptomyces sp. NPDC051776]|uniref:CDGSH iron-sulfur domain-containing protein n=1 Tax=Streptomyces sp. NPDC051776 TaxID=3155414 RepID=UPI0034219681